MKKILVLLLSLLTFGLNAQGTKLKIKQLENPGTSSLNLGANSFSAGAQSTISTLYVPNTATVGVLKIDANGVYNYGNSSDNSSIFYGYREGVNYYSGIENAIFGNNTATLGTTGNDNCFFGASTARSFTAGSNNCVFGSDAMVLNPNGANNIAIGTQALLTFTNSFNIGIGTQALRSATSGSYNLGLGYQSLYTNSTATANTGIGHTALYNTTTGSRNTAIGYNTGLGITTGSANTILGANVTGLATGLTGNIILADGDGNIKYNWTNASHALTGAVGISSVATIGSTVVTVGQPSLLVLGNASVSTNFTASGTASVGSTFTANGASLLNGTVQATGTVNIGPGTFGTTNLVQMRISKGTASIDIGEVTAGSSGIWLGASTPNTGNYAIKMDADLTVTAVNGGGGILDFRTGGTTRMRLEPTYFRSNNPVRIGSTTAPSATLDVTGTMSVSSTGRTGTISTSASYSPALSVLATGNAITGSGMGLYTENSTGGRNFAFLLNDNQYGDFVIRQGTALGSDPFAGNRRFVISPEGNIGINNASPAATLQVSGTMSVSSTSTLNGLNLASGGYSVTTKVIDATAGDAVTINSPVGQFRKDVTGTTFVLTNSQITANSVIMLTAANAAIDATATGWTISKGAGSATITFNAAPTANFDMMFMIMN